MSCNCLIHCQIPKLYYNNNNNNIFIHTCYNCIEQYIPINNNLLRIIKHVKLLGYNFYTISHV